MNVISSHPSRRPGALPLPALPLPTATAMPMPMPMAGPIPHAQAVAQATFSQDAWQQPDPVSALSMDQPRLGCTLLEVIDAIADVADNDDEVLATLAHMLDSGRVRLSGLGCEATTEAQIAL